MFKRNTTQSVTTEYGPLVGRIVGVVFSALAILSVLTTPASAHTDVAAGVSGDDPMPQDLELAATDEAWVKVSKDPRVVCLDDLDDPMTPRVEFVFVTDNPNAAVPRRDMLVTAAWVDRIFADSARIHDPSTFRAVRWDQKEVSPGRCEPIIRKVVVPSKPFRQWGKLKKGNPTGDWKLFRQTIVDAVGVKQVFDPKLGYHVDPPRKILAWVDTSYRGACGHGEHPYDADPDPYTNESNHGVRLAVVYKECWGSLRSTEAHELMHTFGGVPTPAPHFDNAHCSDGWDRMCVSSEANKNPVCAQEIMKRLFDCNGDDYFHPSRPMVASNGEPYWNTADSLFLVKDRPAWWVDYPLDESTSKAKPTSSNTVSPSKGSTGEGSGSKANQTVSGSFSDTVGHVFDGDIARLAEAGITRGCGNGRFCPDDYVTRGEMAAFLTRSLGLKRGKQGFSDTSAHVFFGEIAALADAGITKGCNPPENTLFCPDDPVTRGQMAAFLVRALKLDPGSVSFADTKGHTFAADIAALAEAGITRGCNPDQGNTRFCPDDFVTRGQMAAFLVRAGLAG